MSSRFIQKLPLGRYNIFMDKDPAAVALGKKRWKGKTKAEKTAHALMMNEERSSKMPPEERKASAQKAARARWGPPKKKAAKKTGGKKSG
jgi:hypothetical protein